MAWNGSGGVAQTKPIKKGISKSPKSLLFVLAVVLLGAAVYWFLTSEDVKAKVKEQVSKVKKIAEVEADIAEPVVEEPGEKSELDKKAEKIISGIKKKEKPLIKQRVITPEEWDTLTNRTFKTGTEQLMSWVFSTEVGEMPMPIPNIPEEERENIVSILISKNEILDTDSEKAKECKENVAYAKKEMIQYIKEGGDPDEFLHYYFQELNRAFQLRNEAMDQIQETWYEDPELGEALMEKVNEAFDQEGIKGLTKEMFEE